jgi:hypothetical protein
MTGMQRTLAADLTRRQEQMREIERGLRSLPPAKPS